MALAPRIPALSLLFALLFPAWQASAQTYPSHTVRIIVLNPEGEQILRRACWHSI